MISNRNNFFTPPFHPDPIQRQRSAIQRSKVLTIKTSNLLFTESSSNNIPQQKIKRNLDRQSPILIRRHRLTVENHSPHQQSSDVSDILGNQLQLTSRTLSLHSKTIKHISKFSHYLQTPIWSPTLIDKVFPTRPLRSKSHSLKHTHHPHQKQSSTPDLFISSKSINKNLELFKKTNIKDLVDEWEDPKSNVAVSSDDDDSIITNCNTPILTYNSKKFDHFISLNDKSQSAKSNLQRRPCSFSLTPVVEDINDEIYFC